MSLELTETVTTDPDAVLDYVLDLDDWLTEEGDTLSGTPTITITPAGGLTTSGLTTPTYSGDTVVWWMTGGTANTTYSVTVHWTTAGGREDERTVKVVCRER